MIDKVLPGQKVAADTVNKIIDACNGLQTPSESFVNTPNGTLTPVPGYQARYTYSPVPETVLQAKRGPALKMTSRGATRADDQYSQDQKDMTWFCFLGPDTAALAQCLPSTKTPDSIWLGNSDSALFAEVTDSMLSSLRPAGYYADMAAYGEDAVAVKEVKLTKSDDEEDPGKNVLVICGAGLDDFGKVQEDSRYSEYDDAEVVNTVLFAKINDRETAFQLPLRAQHSQQVDLVGDSQLSATELSSVVVRELSGKPFIELHEFHEDNTRTVGDVSADGVDVLIRNPRGPNDGRELQYVSLSSLLLSGTYIPPDADVEDAETSSLQTRELESGATVEEMFNFHLSGTVDIGLDDLSAYDVVVRNPNGGSPYVQYGRLSVDIYPDAEGGSGQKSVSWRTDGHELQLYKFDENGLTSALSAAVDANGAAQRLAPDEYEFVFRKGGAGGELEYGKVQLSVHADELSGDSQTGEQKSISVANDVIQLYRMEAAGKNVSSEVPTPFDEPESILSDDCEFVIRRGGAGGEIDYTTVKLKQAKLSVDSDSAGQKSVQYNPASKELQLYKMHENGEAGHGASITSAMTSLLPPDYELVVRKGGAGGQIAYTTLSAAVSAAVELDSQAAAQQKSLEWKTQNNKTYAQLYKMDAAGEPTEQVDLKNAKDAYQDLLPDDEEFVIRSAQGGQIKYKNVGVCLSAYTKGGSAVSGDNEYPTLQQKSIDLKFRDGAPAYYQLHDMDQDGTDLPKKAVTMSSDGYTPLLPSDYEFVLRRNGAGGQIQYANLSCCIPDLSALSAAAISGDANYGTLGQNSIQTKTLNEKAYHQLYGFDNPTMIPAASLSSSGYQVVLRDATSPATQIAYAEVSSLVGGGSGISGDANYGTLGQNSIQTKTRDGKTYHQLYDWDYGGYNYEHVLSAAFGSTVYFPYQDGTGGSPSPSDGARVLVKPRESPTDLRYDVFGVRLPKVDVGDVTQNLYDLILSSGGGTDVSAVRQIVIDTLDDAEAKAPLSSNLDDCFWPQGGDNSNCYGSEIGDSQKRRVIDLDSNMLYAVGTNQSGVDWAGGVCYDTQGTQSILWDGRGLVDTGSQWALDWDNRQCLDSSVTPTIDWENGALKVPGSGNNSVDWKTGVLYDPNNGNVALNWDVGYAQDPTGTGITVNWNTGQLWADNNTRTLNWKNRQLIGSWSTNGNLTIGGNGSTLTIGSTTITEAQLSALLALVT